MHMVSMHQCQGIVVSLPRQHQGLMFNIDAAAGVMILAHSNSSKVSHQMMRSE